MLLLSRWLGTGEVKLGKLEEFGSAMAMDRNSASKPNGKPHLISQCNFVAILFSFYAGRHREIMSLVLTT
jgi:hypothetical protein